MNPMTNVKNIQKLNERMLDMGVEDDLSWHKQYKDSAYIFIGGLPYDLTEGDILCVFSQYGEIVNVNLVRDKKTGKQKGFCFLCYEDQRSTILAVDNFNGIKLGGRTIRVDHCSSYRKPKGDEKDEEGNRKEILEEGCAPKISSPSASEDEPEPLEPVKKKKKVKKDKKHKKHREKKSKRKESLSSSESQDDSRFSKDEKQKEKSSKEKSYSEKKKDARLQERSYDRDSYKERDERASNTREWDYGKRTEREDRYVETKRERRDRNEQSSHMEDRSYDNRDRWGGRQGRDSRERLGDRRDSRERLGERTRDRSRDNKYSDKDRVKSKR
ncbi:RNA-binding motif protein, X-linked 2-like [Actinia tenebrosa]|uniref:RNA-binding motif protein, X-linked 2 n=1 Tax=Actinia tenebrosa TaxID=6105 RepID=A0A6P8HGE2_ACTTE|nr:RNA-binding motif protein, X-linked 2-like [Actinia tenebrosa]